MKRLFLCVVFLGLIVGCAPHTLTKAHVPAREDVTRHEAYGRHFMVASQGKLTSQTARKIFEQGGNLVDAAVAASFVLSVERPQSTGLGGGGFMLFHNAESKKTYALDFREMAPAAATQTMFQSPEGKVLSKKSQIGPYAVAVPGLVAGLLEIHQRFGKLPLSKIMQPAIEVAQKGFTIYPHLSQAILETQKDFKNFSATQKLLLHQDGTPRKTGELLRQPALAKTLGEIAKKGARGFYEGWVAKALVDEQKKLGGLLTLQDLQNYKVKWREPVMGRYHGYEVASMPPPSSGGIHVLEILNILEDKNLRFLGSASPQAIHFTAAAMQQAFADRAKYLGDPDFVDVPTQKLISKRYARSISQRIFENTAHPSAEVRAGKLLFPESTETSHLSLMDGQGNAISTTQTINGWFGSGVLVSKAGFFLNNEMDDFSAKPGAPNMFGVLGGSANSISPKKRPLSSMSPTLVFQNSTPILALGSPSGPRIITCVVHSFLNYVEYEMPLFQAISAMRYHHQWYPDEIRVESPSFTPEVRQRLKQMGYKIHKKDYGCRVQAVAKEQQILHGVSDPRGEGLALGDIKD